MILWRLRSLKLYNVIRLCGCCIRPGSRIAEVQKRFLSVTCLAPVSKQFGDGNPGPWDEEFAPLGECSPSGVVERNSKSTVNV